MKPPIIIHKDGPSPPMQETVRWSAYLPAIFFVYRWAINLLSYGIKSLNARTMNLGMMRGLWLKAQKDSDNESI